MLVYADAHTDIHPGVGDGHKSGKIHPLQAVTADVVKSLSEHSGALKNIDSAASLSSPITPTMIYNSGGAAVTEANCHYTAAAAGRNTGIAVATGGQKWAQKDSFLSLEEIEKWNTADILK